ncbi:MAG: hypothetical protein ACPL07_04285, partial [Candidatus Bathyarchaeia archaeon]
MKSCFDVLETFIYRNQGKLCQIGYNLKSSFLVAFTITTIVLVGAGYLGKGLVATSPSPFSIEGGHTEGWMQIVSGGFNDSNNLGI